MQKLHIFIVKIANVILVIIQNVEKNIEEFKDQMIQCHNNRMSTRRIAKTFNISLYIVLYWIKKKENIAPNHISN